MDPNQPAPNTIYNQLNNNPNVIPPQIPVQVPNNNQGFSQGSSIYSQVGPQPTGNIYSAQENNLGLEPKISGNIYLPPPENNIGIQPQVNGNIYIPPPENNPPIAPQVNIEQNNYVPPLINAELPPINNPQNNLPPLNAQISGEVNSPYGLQANVNIYTPPPTVDIVPPTTVSPVTLNAENGPTSTAPLIPPQVSTINTSGGCCGDSSVAEVESYMATCVIPDGYVLKEGIPQRFCDYYNSNGWMVSNTPMADWKACARKWTKDTKNLTKKDYGTEKRYSESGRVDNRVEAKNYVEELEQRSLRSANRK